MTMPILGVLAAVVATALAGPASAETLPGSSRPDTIIVAQATPDAGTRTRRSSRRSETQSKKDPTAGQMMARERQKKCAAEWKSAKAAGNTAGTKWPKFWSQCNARLKGNSA